MDGLSVLREGFFYCGDTSHKKKECPYKATKLA
jgi:hypothetical protein